MGPLWRPANNIWSLLWNLWRICGTPRITTLPAYVIISSLILVNCVHIFLNERYIHSALRLYTGLHGFVFWLFSSISGPWSLTEPNLRNSCQILMNFYGVRSSLTNSEYLSAVQYSIDPVDKYFTTFFSANFCEYIGKWTSIIHVCHDFTKMSVWKICKNFPRSTGQKIYIPHVTS